MLSRVILLGLRPSLTQLNATDFTLSGIVLELDIQSLILSPNSDKSKNQCLVTLNTGGLPHSAHLAFTNDLGVNNLPQLSH